MDAAQNITVAQAWDRVRPFARRSGPSPSAAELRWSWSECARQLTDLFAGHLGPATVAARFDVPSDYTTFMGSIGGGWAWGPGYTPQSLWLAEAVAQKTAKEFRENVTGRPTDGWFAAWFPDLPDDGLWLSIGWFSDKHATLLCCDRQHSDYGGVIDFHDGHPWFNGAGPNDVAGRSFVEWLVEEANGLTRRYA